VIVPVALYVISAPAGMFTVSAILPLPLAGLGRIGHLLFELSNPALSDVPSQAAEVRKENASRSKIRH
jgi:hypothetical protein